MRPWILCFPLLGLALIPATARDPAPPPPSPRELIPVPPPGISEDELAALIEDDLGSGISGALPLPLIAAAIELDPEALGPTIPEAYRRFGFLFLKGRPQLPVGMVAVEKTGLRGHQFNCLVCHAGPDPLNPGYWSPGATNPAIDFGGFYNAVFGALKAEIRGQLKLKGPRGLFPRALLRIRAAAQRQLKTSGRRLSLAEEAALAAAVRSMVQEVVGDPEARPRESYGPGRTLVQGAYRELRFGLDPGPYAPIKTPDLYGARHRSSLLWTGTELYEAEHSPAERIARNGLLVSWIQLHPITQKPIPDALSLLRFDRYLAMGKLLAAATPPAVPKPSPAERPAFERGRTLFEQTCSGCHGSYEHRPAKTPDGRPGLRARPKHYRERIVPLDVVDTDPVYHDVFAVDFGLAFQETLFGKVKIFEGRLTGGYVARPLLGLRMRAPYLHNASVPNLRALLTAPEDRPRAFLVGRGVPFDQDSVGLQLLDPEETRLGPKSGRFVRDDRRPGDRPRGHPFGSELKAAEKRDLLAYLKRL